MKKPQINIVWFKRDLRLTDHAPLKLASQQDLPVLLCFFFEPSLIQSAESDPRHWRFIYQSIQDLQEQLAPYQLKIQVFYQEVRPVFQRLLPFFEIKNLFSHQETGQKLTFDRDLQIKAFCKIHQINWIEPTQDGLIRGAKNRKNWQTRWGAFVTSPLQHPQLEAIKPLKMPEGILDLQQLEKIPGTWKTAVEGMQKGGETLAKRYMASFWKSRSKGYGRHLSKPQLSRKSCSRLSPYLAFGNLSIRQVYQEAEAVKKKVDWSWSLDNFQSRLWWRCHYMQKLESMWQLEFEPINPGLRDIDRATSSPLFDAWANGQTGYPMVDASIRCLQATGWINFRMRAMLATFVTFALWQDWKRAATYLAQLFLDYEPGIHFAQFQMQAGLTGYHPLRIFNPNVQATQHDQDGIFIRTWLPELKEVPAPQIHKPWEMTPMEQTFYNCQIGRDYPSPIVAYDEATRQAKERYWTFRTRPQVLQELPAVWERLCLPQNIEEYRKLVSSIKQT